MDNNQVWDLHRGRWDATTTAMRATSKCNAIDVSHSWRDSGGSNAVVVSGHMDGVVRVRAYICISFVLDSGGTVKLEA